MRNTLVAALVAQAYRPLKSKARRFLLGLSSDELQFIAEYLGACILECEAGCGSNRAPLADRMAHMERPRQAQRHADRELKMILLREYLCCAGVQELPAPPRARYAVN